MKNNSTIDSQFNHLADFVEYSLKIYADKPAYSCLGQTLTFAEIDQKSKALACFLQQHQGLEAGDRIAIQLPNLIQYPIAAYAALRAGLIIVNMNPLYTPSEMQHQFKDSGAKALIILQDLLPKLTEIKAQTDIGLVITTSATDLLTPEVTGAGAGLHSFNQILEQYADANLAERATQRVDDTCVLQYTGGTTGVSKGACLSHGNIISNALQTMDRIGSKLEEGSEILVCPLPLYHIYAFTVNMIMLFSKGNLNVLIPNPRDIDAFVSAIKPYKFTGFAGINTLFVGLCQNEKFQALDFSAFKLTISGGTALTSSAVEAWKNVTGCSITEGYGLSETSPVLCFNTPGAEVIGTVGHPMADTEIQLWDVNDQITAEGQIVARGPQIMSGYWNLPQETEKAITKQGFFKTGDVGIRLATGEIKIVDRLKDLIIVSGFNVYPCEVENVLASHDEIIEAAVIGEPDEKSGEKVCAYITTTGDVDEAAIIAHCREVLTGYKVPKKITIMSELPKSTVGKILRRELRK